MIKSPGITLPTLRWILLRLLLMIFSGPILSLSLARDLITFSLHNPTGVSHRQTPCIAGIPLPQSASVFDPTQLILKDAQGIPQSIQCDVVARWGGSPDQTQRPIKWLHVTLLATLAGHATQTYTLASGTPPTGQSPLTLSETTEEWTIETGTATFVLTKQPFSFFSRIESHEQLVTDSLLNGFSYEAPDGTVFSSRWGRVLEWETVTSGPLRLRLFSKGETSSPNGVKGLDFHWVADFFANSGAVRMWLTLGNHKEAVYLGSHYDVFNYGGQNSITLDSAAFHLTLDRIEELVWTTFNGTNLIQGDLENPVMVLQDSSGTDYWQAYDSSDHPRTNSGSSFRGFQILQGPHLKGTGDHHQGWMDLSHDSAGITLGLNYFWQLFPKGFTCQPDGQLLLDLFPGAYADSFNFRVGEEKTHELILHVHPPYSPQEIQETMLGLLNPPLVVLPGQYVVDTQVLPAFSPEPQTAESRHGQAQHLDPKGLYAYLNDRILAVDPLYTGPYSFYYPYKSLWESSLGAPSSLDYFNYYGWSFFGNQPLDFEAYDTSKAGPFNNKYDLEYGALIQWLRTNDPRWHDMARSFCHHLELLMLHEVTTDTGYDVWRYRDAVFGHSQHNETGNSNGQRNGLGPVTDTSYGARGALLDYYLHANPVSLRFLEKTGRHMTFFYGDAYYGTKRFEQISELGNSVEREMGNAITTLTEAFRHSGDAAFAALIDDIIRHFSSERQSWIHGPQPGASGYVSTWQMTMYLAAVGRYAAVAEEWGRPSSAQLAKDELISFTDWLLCHGTGREQGILHILYRWQKAGNNPDSAPSMINNWMLLAADVCSDAFSFTGNPVYLAFAQDFFKTAVNDPTYLGDAPTYASVREAVNQMTFGHQYLLHLDATGAFPPESQAPSVILSQPASGTLLSGTVTFSAEASDDTGIRKVILMINGSPFQALIHAPYDFALNTRAYSNGPLQVSLVVEDFLGNQGHAPTVTFSIENEPDTQPPSVMISSPLTGSTLQGSVTITVEAFDDSGIECVTFFCDGLPLGSVCQPPFSLNWDTTAVSEGGHRLHAEAIDLWGNTGSSDVVEVTLNNTGNLPPEVDIHWQPELIQIHQAITFFAEATDPEGAPLSFLWTLSNGSQEEGDTLIHSFPQSGRTFITLTVNDGIHQVTRAEELTVFPSGLQSTIELPCAKDTTLFRGGGPYGHEPQLQVYNGTQSDYRSLLYFDLQALSLPAETILANATLWVHAAFVQNAPRLSVSPLLLDWEEHEATWWQSRTGIAWTLPGGDTDETAKVTLQALHGVGEVSVNLTPWAQEWLSGLRPNHGMSIACSDDQAYVWATLDAREQERLSSRPRLVLTFLQPDEPCQIAWDTSPPETLSLCPGDELCITAEVSGTEPWEVSWSKNGLPLPSQTDLLLRLGPVGPDDSGTYTLRVFADCGAELLASTEVDVEDPLYWVTEPLSQECCLHEGVSLTAEVSNPENQSYQWMKDGHDLEETANINGTQTNRLTIQSFSEAEEGYYQVRCQTRCTHLSSQPALLTLTELPFQIRPRAQARGLSPLHFEIQTPCASESYAYQWQTSPWTPTDSNENQLLVPDLPEESLTQVTCTILDANLHLQGHATAWILTANAAWLHDANSDGHNNEEDLHFLLERWQTPEASDANGDGVLDLRDFLFIALPPQGPG